MPPCPVTKHVCLSLSTVKCGFVSELVTRANAKQINEKSNFGIAMFFHVFTSFPTKLPRFLRFSVPFPEFVAFALLGRMLGS